MTDSFDDFSDVYGKQVLIIPISSEFEYENLVNTVGSARNIRFLSWSPSTSGKLTFQAITKAKYIDMRGIQLTDLPPEIGLCTELERLDVRDNFLEFLPPELSQCLKLKDLLFNGNNIYYVSDIQALNQLRQLNSVQNEAPQFKWSVRNCAFNIISWNLVAQSHATQRNFPKTPQRYLEWSYRVDRILHTINQLKPTILCVQEIEEKLVENLVDKMNNIGYESSASFGTRPRVSGQPLIGLVTFYLKNRISLEKTTTIQLADLQGDANINKLQLIQSNAIFQMSNMRYQGLPFYLINTSLQPCHFDPELIVANINLIAQNVDPLSTQVIICGSLGFEPESEAYNLLKTGTACNGKYQLKRRYSCANENDADAFTEWTDDQMKKTDYIWFTCALVPKGSLLTTTKTEARANHLYVPNNQWPSNHLPIGCPVEIKATSSES